MDQRKFTKIVCYINTLSGFPIYDRCKILQIMTARRQEGTLSWGGGVKIEVKVDERKIENNIETIPS